MVCCYSYGVLFFLPSENKIKMVKEFVGTNCTWVGHVSLIIRVCVLNFVICRTAMTDWIRSNKGKKIKWSYFFLSLRISLAAAVCELQICHDRNCAVYDTPPVSRLFCDGVGNGEVVGGLSGGQGRSRGNHAPLARPTWGNPRQKQQNKNTFFFVVVWVWLFYNNDLCVCVECFVWHQSIDIHSLLESETY